MLLAATLFLAFITSSFAPAHKPQSDRTTTTEQSGSTSNLEQSGCLDIFVYYAHAQLQVAEAVANGDGKLADNWQKAADALLGTLFLCMFWEMTQQ